MNDRASVNMQQVFQQKRPLPLTFQGTPNKRFSCCADCDIHPLKADQIRQNALKYKYFRGHISGAAISQLHYISR